MRVLSIFAIIAVLLVTIISASNKPGLHKPYILAPQNFKLEDFSQNPSDLQSILMFKIGEAPLPVAVQDVPIATNSSETPIIPSDVKIIPSDFIQQVPASGSNSENNIQPSAPDNSDKMLQEVGKMIESEQLPQEPKPAKPKADKNDKEIKGSGCSICDALYDPKVRAELIAWNKWRSDIQNRIMDTSYVEAPYGSLFYFTFSVDNQRRVSKISVVARGEVSNKDIENVKTAILRLNNDKILEFPKGTNRKTVSFFGGFLLSDVEMYSTPSDYKDFEYVQTTY